MILRDAIPLSPRLLAHLVARGVPLSRVCARAGIAEDELSRSLPSLTTEAFFAFFRAVDHEIASPEFGLRLGAEAHEEGFSVATVAALHAPNLAEALATMARYKRIMCPEVVDLDVRDGEASVRFHWVLATTEVPRLLVDCAFASFAALARSGTGGKVAPLRVEVVRRGRDARMLRAHFGCPVVAGAPVDRIVFPESALAVPFVTANAEAFARVVPGLEAQLVRRTRARTLRDDVRLAIARNMSGGARPSVDGVAHRLHVSPRTLQRRLGEERTSYQEQLDDVRRLSARRLLAHTELDTNDIAFLLGFEEPNSFTRAFRAWEHTTPARFRQRTA
jgi:AraC-like DNA-binding protein